MNQYSVDKCGISRNNIYHVFNNDRRLVSVDLKKANFQALKYFNPKIVDCCKSYEEFVGQYTTINHIINSKYIRQVIFGNLNPKRQTTIERYVMHFVLDEILKHLDKQQILTYNDDEIVFEDTDKTETIREAIMTISKDIGIEFHFKVFTLKRIPDTNMYVKYYEDGTREFKCVDSWMYPFLLRAYAGEHTKESDFVFIHENGMLAKFMRAPLIETV